MSVEEPRMLTDQYLGDETVQVGVSRALDVERASAKIVYGFVVKHDGHVRVLEKRVRRQNTVVRLHDRIRHLRARIYCKPQFGFLAIIDGKPLEQ